MSNPNPMHSRCGLEDCDCGYVIDKLRDMTGRLAILAEAIEVGAPSSMFDWLKIRDKARSALEETRREA